MSGRFSERLAQISALTQQTYDASLKRSTEIMQKRAAQTKKPLAPRDTNSLHFARVACQGLGSAVRHAQIRKAAHTAVSKISEIPTLRSSADDVPASPLESTSSWLALEDNATPVRPPATPASERSLVLETNRSVALRPPATPASRTSLILESNTTPSSVVLETNRSYARRPTTTPASRSSVVLESNASPVSSPMLESNETPRRPVAGTPARAYPRSPTADDRSRRIAQLQCEYFAEDLRPPAESNGWTDAQLVAFFECGGRQ
jgi:hypothetical protein